MLELKGPAIAPSVGTTRSARPACKVEQFARHQRACGTRRASPEHGCPIYNIHMAVDWRFAHQCGPPLQITVYAFAAANQHAPQHAEPPTDLRQSFCKAQSSLNTQRRCPDALEVQHRPTRPLHLRLSWRLHAAAGLPGPCGRLPWQPVYLLCVKQSAHADMWHGKLIECVENVEPSCSGSPVHPRQLSVTWRLWSQVGLTLYAQDHAKRTTAARELYSQA